MMFEWPLLVATVTQVLVQTTIGYRDMDQPCTFSQDCVPCAADVYCKCNHGRCVSLGPHPNDDPNLGLDYPKIPKECDEGGYKDCDCKYVSYVKRSFSKHALNLINSTQRQPRSLLLYWAWMQGGPLGVPHLCRLCQAGQVQRVRGGSRLLLRGEHLRERVCHQGRGEFWEFSVHHAVFFPCL